MKKTKYEKKEKKSFSIKMLSGKKSPNLSPTVSKRQELKKIQILTGVHIKMIRTILERLDVLSKEHYKTFLISTALHIYSIEIAIENIIYLTLFKLNFNIHELFTSVTI